MDIGQRDSLSEFVERAARQKTVPVPSAQGDDVTELRRLSEFESARVSRVLDSRQRLGDQLAEVDVGALLRTRGQQGNQVCVLDDVGELTRLVPRVDGHDDGAGQRGTEQSLDELDLVV